MKVLFVQHDANLISGVGQVTLNLIDSIRRLGFESCAVLPGEGELSGALADRGVKVLVCPAVIFPGQSVAGALRHLDGLHERAERIAEFIQAENVSLVHSNTGFVIHGALAALKAGVPHLWHFHNNYTLDSKPGFIRYLNLSELSVAHLYGNLADCIVAVSSDSASFFRDRTVPCPVRVIHNGLDTAEFDHAAQAGRWNLRQALAIPPHAPVIGTVGRVTRQKNLILLADSAQRVLQSCPDVHFVVVGPESDMEYAREVHARIREHRIEARMHFVGSRNDLPGVYPQFTMLALSSDWEGLPTVCLEAMAAGIPIVATLCGGTDELIRNGHTGMLVEKNDPESFSTSIIRLLQNPEQAVEMGRAGRERVQREFSLEAFGSRFAEVYHETLAAYSQQERALRLLAAETGISLIQRQIDLAKQHTDVTQRLALVEQLIDKIQATALYRSAKSLHRQLGRFMSKGK